MSLQKLSDDIIETRLCMLANKNFDLHVRGLPFHISPFQYHLWRDITSYNVARVLPYLIPIGVIIVYFSTYAWPYVHQMTCAS